MLLLKKYFVVIFLLVFLANISFAQSNISFEIRHFSIPELQKDFHILRNRYESKLANLYLYTSKSELDHVFDSLYQNISPMTAEQFYSYITPLSSIIKDGHSNLFPPSDATELYNKNAKYFPFNIYWSEDRMYLLRNFSADSTISIGSEILSINGKSVQGIMKFLLDRQVRDGNNENYALWILNTYFREYFSYHFGHPLEYELVLKSEQNSTDSIRVDALTKDQIALIRQTRYFNKVIPDSNLQLDTTARVVIFTIKSWDNAMLSSEVKHLFKVISDNNIQNLILDVRDNQGGNFRPAILLLSYLLDKPFQYFTEVKSVYSHTSESQVLKEENGAMLGVFQNRKNGYKGNLIVLMNGGSFSNTASFCSRIKFYKRGTLIGAESGGNRTVFSGIFGFKGKVTLPNTKIIADNSNYRMVVTAFNENDGHGVIPDVVVVPGIRDLIRGVDPLLERAVKFLKNVPFLN